MPNLRYVSKVGIDAWLAVTLDTGERVSLPYGLAVDLIAFENGRDRFKILEGAYMGRSASVRRDGPTSYLIEHVAHQDAAKLRFDRAQQALWVDGRGPFNAFSGAFDAFTQVPAGTHVVQIPDAPHSATRESYYHYTRYHKTWFRIGTSGDRYLHVGEISEGCVTVRAFLFDPSHGPPAGFDDLPSLPPGAVGTPYPGRAAPLASWDAIYDDLILRRLDHLNVGRIVVE
jgi:hypothetical protein